MQKQLFILCLFFLFLSSCHKEEYKDPVILFGPDELTVAGDGEIRNLDLTVWSDGTYQVTADAGWIAIHSSEKPLKTVYSLVISKNDTGEPRTAVLTIRLGDSKKEVKVTQGLPDASAAPVLEVSGLSNTLPNEGGIASFRIESNGKWKLVKNPADSWFTLPDDALQGEGCAIITVAAGRNEQLDQVRTAALQVQAADDPALQQTVEIRQDCYTAFLSVSTETLQLGKSAQSRTEFTIESTYRWTLVPTADWLNVDPAEETGFLQTRTVTVTAVKSNTTTAGRTAEILIKDGNTTLATVAVTQAADDMADFPLSENNIRVSSYQPGDGSVGALFDNDPATYFTTYWGSYSITVPQWIVIDLGDDRMAQKVSFRYTTRNKLDYVPVKVLLQVTDEAPTAHIWQQEGDAFTDSDRNWTTVATFEGEANCPQKTGAESAELTGTADKKYRYWRFFVEKARQNPAYEADYPDAFCFQLAELKVRLYQ